MNIAERISLEEELFSAVTNNPDEWQDFIYKVCVKMQIADMPEPVLLSYIEGLRSS